MKKTYTLEEILACKEAEEILQAVDSADIQVIEAILDTRYGSYDAERKEYVYTIEELEKAIDEMDSITRYSDIDSYHDCCDETLKFNGDSQIERYFDYDAYHRDCDFDITEASNGIVLYNY